MSDILTKKVLLNNVEKCMIQTYDFILKYLPLANGHNTDFIIDDLWNTLIPEKIRHDLDHLNNEISIISYCNNRSENYHR